MGTRVWAVIHPEHGLSFRALTEGKSSNQACVFLNLDAANSFLKYIPEAKTKGYRVVPMVIEEEGE